MQNLFFGMSMHLSLSSDTALVAGGVAAETAAMESEVMDALLREGAAWDAYQLFFTVKMAKFDGKLEHPREDKESEKKKWQEWINHADLKDRYACVRTRTYVYVCTCARARACVSCEYAPEEEELRQKEWSVQINRAYIKEKNVCGHVLVRMVVHARAWTKQIRAM